MTIALQMYVLCNLNCCRVFKVTQMNSADLKCNTEKDCCQVKHHTAGTACIAATSLWQCVQNQYNVCSTHACILLMMLLLKSKPNALVVCSTRNATSSNYITTGIVVGAWPCGTVVMIGELFGAESKSQVYGTIHTFLHENEEATRHIRKYMKYSVHNSKSYMIHIRAVICHNYRIPML